MAVSSACYFETYLAGVHIICRCTDAAPQEQRTARRNRPWVHGTLANRRTSRGRLPGDKRSGEDMRSMAATAANFEAPTDSGTLEAWLKDLPADCCSAFVALRDQAKRFATSAVAPSERFV